MFVAEYDLEQGKFFESIVAGEPCLRPRAVGRKILTTTRNNLRGTTILFRNRPNCQCVCGKRYSGMGSQREKLAIATG